MTAFLEPIGVHLESYYCCHVWVELLDSCEYFELQLEGLVLMNRNNCLIRVPDGSSRRFTIVGLPLLCFGGLCECNYCL